MHIYITCPHSRAGGGTKVLLNLAQGLASQEIPTTVIFRKFTDIEWYGEAPLFTTKVLPYITYQDMPDCSGIIHYGDDSVYGPYPNVPRILYLQGFGTQDYTREVTTLFFPYTKVVAVSPWVAGIAKQAGHKDVRVIPPAVDPYFKKCRSIGMEFDQIIGTVYHAAHTKNIMMLLRALEWIVVNKKGKTCCLLISALPPEKDHKKFIEQLGIQHSFYVNPVRTELPAIYSAATTWVSTSFAEGFGLPPLEAMACNVPVVTTRTLGLVEVLVDHNNCLLVDSPKEMGKAIVAITEDKALREKLVKGGQVLSGQYTMTRFIQSFVDLLDETRCIA